MGGSASEEFLAESEVGEDTYVRCLESGYAANVEAVITAVRSRCRSTVCPEAKVHDTPGTPTIATLVEWANRALGRTVTAADTLKNVMLKSASPAATGSCWRWGCPATARSTTNGWPPRSTRRVRRCSTTPTSPSTCSWRRAISVRKRCWPTVFASSSIPRWWTGRRGSPAPMRPASTWWAWSPGRDFVADGTIEAAEVRDGDPSPDGAGPLVSARGSRSATSSSSAASTPTRSPSTCSARTGCG